MRRRPPAGAIAGVGSTAPDLGGTRANLGRGDQAVKSTGEPDRVRSAGPPRSRQPGDQPIGQLRPRRRRLDPGPARRRPGRLERDHPASGGNRPATRSAHSTRETPVVPVVGGAQVFERRGRRQPVGVEVVDRHAAVVLLDQHERRAGDRLGIDPERLGDRADQPRLAGAERTDQADDGPRLDELRERPAQAGGLLFGGEVNLRSGRLRGRTSPWRPLILVLEAKVVEPSRLDRRRSSIGVAERPCRAPRRPRRCDTGPPARGARPAVARRPRATTIRQSSKSSPSLSAWSRAAMPSRRLMLDRIGVDRDRPKRRGSPRGRRSRRGCGPGRRRGRRTGRSWRGSAAVRCMARASAIRGSGVRCRPDRQAAAERAGDEDRDRPAAPRSPHRTRERSPVPARSR